MTKRTVLFILIWQFSLALAQEQKIQFNPISSQAIDADEFVGLDGLENLYYLKNNILFKKHKTELWQYENIYLGKITNIDIQNPLKIILFYENFNTIIMLDNQLNEIQKINFSENDVPIMVAGIGIASQNRLWIYNSLSQQIGLFDYLKNTFQLLTPVNQGNMKDYDSDFNTFRWIDEKLNWYSCDVFGKIVSLGKVSDFDQIQFVSNYAVVFSKNKKLYLQDLKKNSIYNIENIDKSFANFYCKDQILSIFTNQKIYKYKIITP